MKIHRLPYSTKWLIEVIGTAIIYYAAARLGLLLAFQNTNASPVWPPSGIAFAMILLLGYRILPGIMMGAFLANVVVFLANKAGDTGSIIAVSSFIAIGNTLEAVSGAFLLQRFVGSRNPLDRSGDIFVFVLVALLMSEVSSTIGATSLCVAGIIPWALSRTVWFTWWVGDTVGILILTPFLWIWFKQPFVRWKLSFVVESVLFLILLLLVCQIVFGQWPPIKVVGYPLLFTLIPLIVGAAFRFGQSAVVLSTLLVSAFAIWGTIHGSGPFVRETLSLNESLWLVQGFVCIITVTGLLLAAVLTERKKAKEALQKAHDELETRVRKRTEELGKANKELQAEVAERNRAEQGLENSLSLLRATLESTTDGIIVVDREGKIATFNQKFVEMWRIPESVVESHDGNKALAFVQDQLIDPEGFLTKVREIYSQVDAESYDILEFKDGRIFELYSQPQQIGEAILGRVWSFRDVTKRKQAEEALRDSLAQLSKKNRYETIISTVTRGVHKSINLQNVFENAVEAMSKNIDGMDNLGIYLVEGGEAVLKAHKGYNSQYIERAGRIPYPKGFTWKTIIEGEPRYCPDVDKDTIIGPAGREMGTKSYLSMPIQFQGNTVGCININSLEKNAFDEEELKLLEIVAQQIQIAINNAQQAEALSRSEERYRDLVENSLDLICIHDLEGNILSVNRALIKQLGYERAEDFVGRKISDFLSPHMRHLFSSYIDTITKVGEARGLMRVLTRSGEERILEYNNSLRTEGVSKPIIRGVSHDITERKKAEEALQQSHAHLAKKNRYETIISTVTQSVHKSINLQDVLENAVEAMSKNIDGVDNVSIYMVEGQEAVIRAYRGYPQWFIERAGRIPYPRGFTWKTIIEGEARYCPDVDEDTIIGPAGREIGTKSYLSMPIRFQGNTVGCININSLEKNAFDEEELKLLEIVAQQIQIAINNAGQAEALQESREKFRSLVEQTSDFVWEIDENGIFTYINPKAYEILGYEPREILGKTVFDFMYPDEAKRFAEVIGSFISMKSPFKNLEKTLIHKDGYAVVLEASGSPILSTEGILRGYRGIARDITERKQAEEALLKAHEELEIRVWERTADLIKVNEVLQAEISDHKRAEERIKVSLQEKEVLLREIHHRVKNNLQVISALLRLQCGFSKDAETRKLFDETQNRIQSMSLIHQQLYKSTDLKRIEFTKYIQNLAYHLFRSYGVSSDTIALEIRSNEIKLNIDTAISCGLIMNELVSNSLKYAFPEDKNGKVYIYISSDEDRKYTLIVGDDGVGLPNDIDFRNTESLGLQVVVTLVEQIEGTIEIDRSKGTEFKIKFKEPNNIRTQDKGLVPTDLYSSVG